MEAPAFLSADRVVDPLSAVKEKLRLRALARTYFENFGGSQSGATPQVLRGGVAMGCYAITWAIIDLTNPTILSIFSAWKRHAPYSKRFSTSAMNKSALMRSP